MNIPADSGTSMRLQRNAPDPDALLIAREIQERLQPAEVILLGSRAVGDYHHDSDVDLMAVCPDEETVRETDEILMGLLEGKYEAPVVNVTTITREEFRRTAPLAQSPAGQAARHGVTSEGKSLDYQPESQPEAAAVLQATIFWILRTETHLDALSIFSESGYLTRSDIAGLDAQWALERGFKSLLTAGNDNARFRRDAAVMWRYMESTRPIADREGRRAMNELLSATAGPDGQGCRLTEFSEAFRRDDLLPELSDLEWEAVWLHLVPAVNALITEALERSGGTREDVQRERQRRRSGDPGRVD